jgi:hypothetical protein
MYCPSLQHQPNTAKSTGLLKSLTASMQHQNRTIRFAKLIKNTTRRRPALSTRLHSTNLIYSPACNISQIQPNPLACSNRSNPSKQPPNITQFNCDNYRNTARRRPAPSTRLHSTNFMYCPSLQRQPNSAKSTGLLKSLKPIQTAAKYYTSTRKTSYQRGRRRSAHATRFPTTNPIYHRPIAKLIYHGKTYTITSLTPFYIALYFTL